MTLEDTILGHEQFSALVEQSVRETAERTKHPTLVNLVSQLDKLRAKGRDVHVSLDVADQKIRLVERQKVQTTLVDVDDLPEVEARYE